MKQSFYKADWFTGLLVTVAIAVLATLGYVRGLESWAYDQGVRLSSRTPSDRVAVIAIDDQSINNIGRWPWSRDVHARMLDILAGAGAKVIGSMVLFLEPEVDRGLAQIDAIGRLLSESSLVTDVPGEVELLSAMVSDLAAGTAGHTSEPLANEVRSFLQGSSLVQRYGGELEKIEGALAKARENMSTDAELARSIEKAGNVVLGMPFFLGRPQGKPDPLPDYVVANALPNVTDRIGAVDAGLFPLPTHTATAPIPVLGRPAAGIGNVLVKGDVDARSEPLVTLHYDAYYPSLALLVAARSLNLGLEDVEVRLGEGVRLGNLEIRTDDLLQMYNFFYAGGTDRPAFEVDSFFDVLEGKIPPAKYRDRIVLIGPTAAGLGAAQQTPISPAMAPVLTLAHTVSSILAEDFFVIPAWGYWAKIGAFLLIAAYLVVLLPRLPAGRAAVFTVVLAVVALGAELGLMSVQATWIEMMTAVSLLLAGHLAVTTKRFLVTERGKLRSEAESAESNRMLGLAYQGQGQLDMAFDKFRKLPMDDSVADLLYNLGLDYERKRQFNKAGSVYQHISSYNAKFRDIAQKLSRSKAMEETVLLGGAGGGGAAGTLLLDGEGIQKPMLGRYEVEKELGKGAMGVVYLGRDPKINRVVAIKTMALSQEFEEDELDEVKARFFREAETAGRLNHPHIVTIYDAGEEHDLAYIAMEFLKGKDLMPYTKYDNLLPLAKVLEVTAQSAEALDYAHAQNVVHRDIKPANIMYEPDTGNVKLTDFGIARITDSSRTKTGMVLGTPSYMSPEQLAGKKVDGRSDLFSLGAMLYQLTSGALPFQGDSMATLMFKIANEPHPDITTLRPDIPPGVKAIIDKALQKTAENRYQRGAEMARDLRACAATVTA